MQSSRSADRGPSATWCLALPSASLWRSGTGYRRGYRDERRQASVRPRPPKALNRARRPHRPGGLLLGRDPRRGQAGRRAGSPPAPAGSARRDPGRARRRKPGTRGDPGSRGRRYRPCHRHTGAPRGDAEQPLRAWFAEARRATWRTPSDVKAAYRNASLVGNDRVVFNIGGNKYRLVVALKYSAQIAFIRFVGTHAAYDTIDVEEV